MQASKVFYTIVPIVTSVTRGENEMGEPEKERTTIELFKEPDLTLLRNLKASLTLKFDADASYRDAILYLFASHVLGTETTNLLIEGLLNSSFTGQREDFPVALNTLIHTLGMQPGWKKIALEEWRSNLIGWHNNFVGSITDRYSKSRVKQAIAEYEHRDKLFHKALDKLEKAGPLWGTE